MRTTIPRCFAAGLVDFSDIPELTAEQLADAVRARELQRSLYKPVKALSK
jgi:hypothetical protein